MTQPAVIGHVTAKRYFPQQPIAYEFSHEASTVVCKAQINGRVYLVPRASVEINAHGAADSATITLPLRGSPDFSAALDNIQTVPVQVYLGIFQGQPPVQNLSISGLTQVFDGQLDVDTTNITEDDYSITFRCRSLAAMLIDNRLTALPRNMTTVRFVAAIAKQYGLTASIMLPKGQYPITVAEVYSHDFAVGIQNDRIWDILQKMAQIDDTDVWVTGSTLYYAAPSLIPRSTIDIKYGRDIEVSGAVFEHSRQSKKIRVEVRTYNPKTRISNIARYDTADGGGVDVTTSSKLVTSNPEFGSPNTTTTSVSSTGVVTTSQSTVLGTGATNASATGSGSQDGPLVYKIYKPGLSPEAANLLAQATWRRISMMEYVATINVPLTRAKFAKGISITSLLRLHGFPISKANGTFWPRKITLSIDIDNGANVVYEAVNTELPAGEV